MSAVVPIVDVMDILKGVLVLGEARLAVDDQGREVMTVPYGAERTPTVLVIDSAEAGGYLLGGFRTVRQNMKAKPHHVAAKIAVRVLMGLARDGLLDVPAPSSEGA